MMQTPDKFKAGATSLDVVNNLKKYIPREFKNFKTVGFEELFAIEGKFRLDIKVKAIDKRGKEISILIDTKNYGSASGMFGNFKQLKAYLGEIHSFDELKNFKNPSGTSVNKANPNTDLPTQMSKKWVFDKVRKKLIHKNKLKLTAFENKQRELAKFIRKNQNIVERYVFAIDKTDGAGYITKLSDNF